MNDEENSLQASKTDEYLEAKHDEAAAAVEPATVKAPEAAKILNMHEGNVRKLAVEGKLHGEKKGRSWVFKLQDVFALKQARDKAQDPRL
jgi:excisionase family DNA binding protein